MVENRALLVMDVQAGILSRLADRAAPLMERVARAVDGARGARVPVLFVRVAFRPGNPEVSPKNRTFSQVPRDGTFEEHAPGTQIAPPLVPRSDEPIVTKRRISAFAGSDLEVLLRARSIDHLALTGVATSGVVLSTFRQAADLDFALTVLRDGCADMDDEVHRVLLEKVFPRQGTVLSVEDWLKTLRDPGELPPSVA
jgi:nicotinamidase-related amidase